MFNITVAASESFTAGEAGVDIGAIAVMTTPVQPQQQVHTSWSTAPFGVTKFTINAWSFS